MIFITPENVPKLFDIYFNHIKLDYKKEINDFWISFYNTLIRYIRYENYNLDLFFSILNGVNVDDEKFYNQIDLLIKENTNEKNYLMIFEKYSKVNRKKNKDIIINQQTNHELNLKNHELNLKNHELKELLKKKEN
jgi:hypothetical protein